MTREQAIDEAVRRTSRGRRLGALEAELANKSSYVGVLMFAQGVRSEFRRICKERRWRLPAQEHWDSI